MTFEQLQAAEAAYQAASRVAETKRAERNDAIRAALKAGMSQAAIAQATGLTRGRINQLRG